MTERETPGGDHGRDFVKRSEDGRLVLRLSELAWETEFFGRRFGRLAIDVDQVQNFDVKGLDQSLEEVLAFGDQTGFDLIELELDVSRIHLCNPFEDRGFRLVDTKTQFLTLKQKEEMQNLPPPTRETCLVSEDMKEEILDLTRRAFAENPSFKSRYNNRSFFSRPETERYYAAWIENYIGDRNALFAVARDQGKIVGYLVYSKTGEHRGKPLYKAILMAVDPEYRGRRVYFDLRSFVYGRFPERELYLDTTTQLSNLSVIKNLIRAQKTLESIRFLFYRPGLEKPGRPRTTDSREGGIRLGLSEMRWETEFFGRRFGRLEIDEKEKDGWEAEDLETALKETLSFGDQSGFDVIEAQLDISWLHHMCLLENNGFRLVDTKLRFLTWMTKAETEDLPPPTRQTFFVSEDMKEEILALTRKAFASNPSFMSRFNNESFFSRSETERYYAAWIENYIGDRNALFAVARDEGKIVGYLVYSKTGEHRGKPLYKAILMAVDPEYRGRRVYFDLRSFVYGRFPEREVYLDTTTQLSNLSALRNFIKTRKTLDDIKIVFYRRISPPTTISGLDRDT